MTITTAADTAVAAVDHDDGGGVASVDDHEDDAV
jgi:hypothetical protein